MRQRLEAKNVAPHAGAWIETRLEKHQSCRVYVAPHAGAWIETGQAVAPLFNPIVAPHAGAWIETGFKYQWMGKVGGRAPRGRVD